MFRATMRTARSVLRNFKHWLRVARGFDIYRRTGCNTPEAYQSLIKLYCETNGSSNDLFHALLKTSSRKYDFPSADGVLGNLTKKQVSDFGEQIRTNGYCTFPQRLSPEVCDALTRFATTHSAPLFPRREGCPERAVYSRENPLGDTYWFEEQSLLDCAEIQQLMADLSLLSVAQAYLECAPILDIVGMWWSTIAHFEDTSKGAAGQLFHFDMNRVKWLKVMFYLTDVDSGGGPHCFVKKTHKAGTQPRELLRNGYVRYTDEEVRQFYSEESIVELTGKRGTIVAVDTRGLHKGKTPDTHDRLVFQLNFCDSLFGAKYESPRIGNDAVPVLLERFQQCPDIFARFTTQMDEIDTVRSAAA